MAGSTVGFAQGNRNDQAAIQARRDSTAAARQASLDSARQSRQHLLDSAKTSRQRVIDSVKSVREARTDSLTAVRKYKESRRYRDSVEQAREDRVAEIRTRQTARMDSTKAARQAASDSALAVRRQFTDSVKAVQQQRTDSMMAIRKYKESKRYQDSVTIVRRQSLDSMRAARTAALDVLKADRLRISDSTKTARTAALDALKAERTRITDSIKVVRQARTDSLLAVKEKRDKASKVREEKKKKDMQLAIELKIKSKREAWNNEKMLKKKWGPLRRGFQNTFTHYNYYFNANRKMDEAEANMERIAKDNFDKLLPLYTFDPDRDSATLAGDMDSVIQKASLGIQVHDPRTKWADDLYLLLGQAYYYRGDYDNATAAFHYIVGLKDRFKKKNNSYNKPKPKPDDKPTNKVAAPPNEGLASVLRRSPATNDALLWLCRTYTQSGDYDNATLVLDLLSTEPDLPESMAGKMAVERGFLALKMKEYREAAQQLSIAAADHNLPNLLRRRAAFIAGQLLYEQGDYQNSATQYRTVVDLKPKLDMDFYARKGLADALIAAGGDQQEALASLRSVINDNKYAPYHEQVYYQLGRLAANSGNRKDAIEYLRESLASAKTTKKQKTISFAALGNAYYDDGNYFAAGDAYDSLKSLASNAPNDPDVMLAQKRARALAKVITPTSAIRTQDSLLALAALPEKEQVAAVRKYIKALEKRRADSIANAELNANNPTLVAAVESNDLSNNPAYNWYFSNASLMQNGLAEFKKKWGNRPLADNWRRAAAMGFGNGSNGNTPNSGQPIVAGSGGPDVIGANAGGNSTVAIDANGLPTEASLLSAIPTTDVRRQQATDLIQRSYMDLGNAYVTDLEDYPRATAALDTLDSRYTTHSRRAEALYLRYQVSLRNNQLPQAQGYAGQILQDYNNTQYADLVRPASAGTDVNAVGVNGTGFNSNYDETYSLLQNHGYSNTLERLNNPTFRNTEPRYAGRITVMRATAMAGQGQYAEADTLLSNFVRANPNDSLRAWADDVLKYIRAQQPAAPPVDTAATSRLRGSVADSSAATATPPPGAARGGVPPVSSTAQPVIRDTLAAPSPASAPMTTQPGGAAPYTYNPTAKHLFIFQFGKAESKTLGVKSGLNDLNNLKFGGQGLTVGMDVVKQQLGFLTVGPFATAAAAKAYLQEAEKASQLTQQYKAGEFSFFIISEANYALLRADQRLDKYLEFYNKKYQ